MLMHEFLRTFFFFLLFSCDATKKKRKKKSEIEVSGVDGEKASRGRELEYKFELEFGVIQVPPYYIFNIESR